MMNSDRLGVAHSSEVTLAPKGYWGHSQSWRLTNSGDRHLSLHGTDHELTAPMQIHIDGTSLAAKTHFPAHSVQLGLIDPSGFILNAAKEVDIDLTLDGRVSASH